MTYRQVIMHGGVPFSLEIPNKLATRDTMSDTEFDTMMSRGLAQAKSNESISVDDAFSDLRTELAK
jgi:antitoxin component of RelBE/YafQ-DinJ toxin-antitoxin module